MPLSEHEQRLLDQIERELYAEDPKFASTVSRGNKLRRPARRRRIQGLALFVCGIALLVFGVILPFRVAEIPLISVFGFLIMFAGVVLALTAGHAAAQEPVKKGKAGASPSGSAKQPRRGSFAQRMEERFRQRFEDR